MREILEHPREHKFLLLLLFLCSSKPLRATTEHSCEARVPMVPCPISTIRARTSFGFCAAALSGLALFWRHFALVRWRATYQSILQAPFKAETVAQKERHCAFTLASPSMLVYSRNVSKPRGGQKSAALEVQGNHDNHILICPEQIHAQRPTRRKCMHQEKPTQLSCSKASGVLLSQHI